MFTLIIKKSKSKNFNKVLERSLSIGGSYDGSEIRISIKEKMEAYTKLFPLFKFNALKWKGTKAFYNKEEVNPYRFMFLYELKRKSYMRDIMNDLERSSSDIPSFWEIKNTPFLYYKRTDNLFFFKNQDYTFDFKLLGKELYEFIDQFSVGDEIIFNDLPPKN